jgi:MarR family transcriptional regulator for hemolysin
MPAPTEPPVGLHLTRVAKTVHRAFDEALATAGGSLPTWLILLSLKTRNVANQRELAEAVGIRGATLTHHLDALEADGLVTRERDLVNRRIHHVALTETGEKAFHRMRETAVAFDQRLRAGLPAEAITTFGHTLDHLHHNATHTPEQEAGDPG